MNSLQPALRFFLLVLASAFALSVFSAPPASFSQAKSELRKQVYVDQNQNGELGTLYCGCNWRWVGKTGGRVDQASCGYTVRAQPTRANRTEWEHIVPAHAMGNQRQCWQNGGRKNCNATDPVFNAMEADMHNLSVAIGEVNADRSNYRMGMVANKQNMYGACSSRPDFKQRVFEPRDKVKGLVARVYFYMHDRYDLSMSKQQQQLFIAWHNQYPPSVWEIERNQRIKSITGNGNEFVTGERIWRLGHKNSADGVVQNISTSATPKKVAPRAKPIKANYKELSVIHGNKNSKIYHLSNCPSYNSMKPSNIVQFSSEAAAVNAGYRKARNCPKP